MSLQEVSSEAATVMDICALCHRKFPDGCCAPYFANGCVTQVVCGVCALAERNETHGLPPSTPFKGEEAQATYERAARHLGIV